MIRTIAVSAALLLASAQVPAPPPLIEKITVNVVNIDVAVMDRHGHPVRGLDRQDFEIIEDDQPQEVSNFSVVDDAAPRVEARRDAPATAAAPAEERFRRKVLVLIDNLNTSSRSRHEALVRLEIILTSHFDDGRYDWSVATVDRRVHLLMAMTSDKSALHAVLADISPSASHPQWSRGMPRDASVAILSNREGQPGRGESPSNATSNAELSSQMDPRTTLTIQGF